MTCRTCAKGYYSDSFSLNSCTACSVTFQDPHRTTAGLGSTSNQSCVCNANLIPQQQKENGGPCGCPPGQELDLETSSCQSCSRGYFKELFGIGNCTSCETVLGPGATTATSGSTMPDLCECPRSFVSNGTRCGCPPGYGLSLNSICTECALGYFSDTFTIDEECHSCAATFGDPLLTTTTVGTKEQALCKCTQNLEYISNTCGCGPGKGYYAATESCQTCSINTFSESFDLDPCVSCVTILGVHGQTETSGLLIGINANAHLP